MNALADTSKDKSESSDKREEIVGKLNEALGALRRERDELHRSKELSNERLCLIREERQALEKTVQAMRLTLKDLTEKAALSEENDDTETELQAEVDRLTKEVGFSYSFDFLRTITEINTKFFLFIHNLYLFQSNCIR